MKEIDYLRVTNLTRLRDITVLLESIMRGNNYGVAEEEFDAVSNQIWDWIKRLEKKAPRQ